MPTEKQVRLVIEVPLSLKHKFLCEVNARGTSMTYVITKFLESYIPKK